jgi:hypothetical protein
MLRSVKNINKKTADKCMKKIKLILASGAILLSGALCQTANASLLNIAGSSTLGNSAGVPIPMENLIVDWRVVENASLVYTYSYTVYNPIGDVLLPTIVPPSLGGGIESVDGFSVAFNTTVPGLFLPGTYTGGFLTGNEGNDGNAGLFWSFAPVPAGSKSPILSFQSDYGPTVGNANAQDADPPSPWASTSPGGTTVPVPSLTPMPGLPEPTTLISGALLLLPFGASSLRILRKNRAA